MGDRAKKRGANIGEDDGMYSLVIAEDEKMMRESLVKLVDWASPGFTMEAAFSDGALHPRAQSAHLRHPPDRAQEL